MKDIRVDLLRRFEGQAAVMEICFRHFDSKRRDLHLRALQLRDALRTALDDFEREQTRLAQETAEVLPCPERSEEPEP